MVPLAISESGFASWEYRRIAIEAIYRFILMNESVKEPPVT